MTHAGSLTVSALLCNTPISPRIVFFFNLPDLDQIVPDHSFDCPPVLHPITNLFLNQIESRSINPSWGTILGRSLSDAHVSGTKIRAGIRQRPDRDPLFAPKIVIFGQYSAKYERSQFKTGRFVPLCDRLLPFFSRLSFKSGQECAYFDAGGNK